MTSLYRVRYPRPTIFPVADPPPPPPPLKFDRLLKKKKKKSHLVSECLR